MTPEEIVKELLDQRRTEKRGKVHLDGELMFESIAARDEMYLMSVSSKILHFLRGKSNLFTVLRMPAMLTI